MRLSTCLGIAPPRVSALQTAVEDHEDADPDRVSRRARRRLLDGDEVGGNSPFRCDITPKSGR